MANNHPIIEKELAERLWRGLLRIQHPVAVARFGSIQNEIDELRSATKNRRCSSVERKRIDELYDLKRRLTKEMPPPELCKLVTIGDLFDHWHSNAAHMILKRHLCK